MAISWTPAEVKNCKLENPSLSCLGFYSSIPRKRQATGFEPLRHKCYRRPLA